MSQDSATPPPHQNPTNSIASHNRKAHHMSLPKGSTANLDFSR
jgi:hypothetical protein